MRAPIITTLFILIATRALAGGDQWPVGARAAGMGNAGITLTDVWSVQTNQAGLAGIDHPTAGAYYQQHWLASDLALQGIAFALPVGKGCFGVSANSFGGTLYAEHSFGLAYAMKLSGTFRAGVRLGYLDLRFGENYGSRGALTSEFGVQAELTKHLWIGAHLYNPNRATIGGPYDEKVPTIFGAGLGYTFNEHVLACAQVDKDIDRDERYHVGVEYRPAKALVLRTGFSSGPMQAHFGAGVRLKKLDIDIAVTTHAQLGTTPMIALNYRFE